MTQPYDLDRRVVSFLEEGPAALNDRILDLVRQDIHEVRQRRRPRKWRIGPMSLSPVSVTVAIGAATLMLGLAVMGSWLGRSVGDPPPATPAVWSGPVRSDAAEFPVLPLSRGVENGNARLWAADPLEADATWVDITRVYVDHASGSQPGWFIELAGAPPRAASLDPEQTIISYGLVFDATGDGVPDYEVGINNDVATRGHFRVWVIDLATGERDERTGPPYGFPVEFRHPDEHRFDGTWPEALSRTVMFTFLGRQGPNGDIRGSTPFYAWASVTRDGEVVAWDYAADGGWLSASQDTAP